MENQQDMQYSGLEVDDSMGALESSIFMKKVKMYTKHLAKVFDIGNSGISSEVSKGIDLRKSKYIEYLKNSNVDDNIITTTSYSTEINEHSLQLEDKKITNINLLKTQSKAETKSSDDTYVKIVNLNYNDSGKSEGSDKKTVKDYMPRMEKFLYDFDKANSLLIKPRIKELNASLELINSLTSSNTNNDKKNIINENINEPIKFITPKTSDGECEKQVRKQDLACMLSDNSLLETAMEQLRIKFKEFFVEFDMKTNTFKTPKDYQKHHKSSTKKVSTANLRKTNIINKGPKMNGVDTIERSKKKQWRILRNSGCIQRLKISNGHFDINGFCIRSISPTKKDTVDAQKLRRKSENFVKVFSRNDQIAKTFIPVSKRICSNSSGKITIQNPKKNKDRRGVVEERNSLTCKIAKGDDENVEEIYSKIHHPMFKSNISSSKNEPSNLTNTLSVEINVSCCKIDPGVYTNRESRVSDALKVMATRSQPPMDRLKRSTQDCNFSGGSGKSPSPIDIPNAQSNDINDYCSEFDGEGGSSDISVSSSNSKTSTNEINNYCADFNVSIRSDNSKITSRDYSFILDKAIEDSNSSTETECCPHLQDIASGDSLEINKYIGRTIGVTYAYVTPSPAEKNSPSRNIQEDDELVYDIGRSQDCDGLSEREGSSQNSMISERRTQKIANIHSLPVGNDGLIFDPSLSVSVEICNNLQSTCMYFDENKTVTELVAVLLQRDCDMDDVLENIGGYEDFEKPLLFNSRLTSETNQTV